MKPIVKFKTIFASLLLILFVKCAVSKDETELGQFVRSFTEILEKYWSANHTNSNDPTLFKVHKQDTFEKVIWFFKKSDNILRKCRDISEKTINSTFKNFPEIVRIQLRTANTREYILYINSKFATMRNYFWSIHNFKKMNETRLEGFAKSVLLGTKSVEILLQKLNTNFLPYPPFDYLEEISKEFKVSIALFSASYQSFIIFRTINLICFANQTFRQTKFFKTFTILYKLQK